MASLRTIFHSYAKLFDGGLKFPSLLLAKERLTDLYLRDSDPHRSGQRPDAGDCRAYQPIIKGESGPRLFPSE